MLHRRGGKEGPLGDIGYHSRYFPVKALKIVSGRKKKLNFSEEQTEREKTVWWDAVSAEMLHDLDEKEED